MASVRFTISLPDSLAKPLDKLRGDVPRSAYIKSIIEPVINLRVAKTKGGKKDV